MRAVGRRSVAAKYFFPHPPAVIPAKAGIQEGGTRAQCVFWIPAFAGMTAEVGFFSIHPARNFLLFFVDAGR